MKIKIITNYKTYKKDQIIDLDDQKAIPILTNGKAIRIHRKSQVNSKENKSKKQKDDI